MERVRTVDPIQQVRDAAQAAGGVRSVRDVDRAQREVARFVGARPHPAVFVVDALPDIDPQWYGRIVLVRGGTGIADAAYVLLRRANETLIWKRIDPDTSGTAPTLTVLAAAGTGAPAANVAGNDYAGSLDWTTGTTPAAGAQVTVTFAQARANTNYVVILSATEDDAASRNLYATAKGTLSWQVAIQTAPTASRFHSLDYLVVGR